MEGDGDRFLDAEACSKLLEGEWREKWQRADMVMTALAIRDDLNIVELGAGTGYFTKKLAAAASKGKVLALDVEQSMVDWITDLSAKQGLSNITAKLVAPEDPKLDQVPFSFDMFFVAYTYHHLRPKESRVAYMRDKVRPSMPKDALLVIADFEEFPPNPPPHIAEHAKDHPPFIKPEDVKEEMASAGFTFVTDYDFDVKPNYLLAFKVC